PFQDGKPDFAAVRRAVREHVTNYKSKQYDFALIDEGQDLGREDYEVLTAVSAHVTVLMDPRQGLYAGGCCEADVLAALGIDRAGVSLLGTFRSSPGVVGLAAALADDAEGDKLRLQ